jgi:hypothetical protein
MAAATLPVSGAMVVLRRPNGLDDVFLAESRARDTAMGVALLDRVGAHVDGSPVAWREMSLTDIDVALLLLRTDLLGDVVRTAVKCQSTACGERFDVSFRIGEYLTHHRPHRPRHVESQNESGWFGLLRTDVSFRLPTVEDVASTATEGQAAIVRRCIRPMDVSPSLRRRVERAMETMAPSLYDTLDCSCHECGVSVPIMFNPVAYVLEELSRRAQHVYEEVHVLALAYGWSEREILTLPHDRRTRYAELASSRSA